MTAEERMAYFQGTKRRTDSYPVKSQIMNRELLFFKIKFFIAVILFIIFLSMDYTGYQIYGIGTEDIVLEVTKDIELQLLKADDIAL